MRIISKTKVETMRICSHLFVIMFIGMPELKLVNTLFETVQLDNDNC